VHLDLIDPLQLILDRIFRGDDLQVRTVDLQQGAVEGRGLARTRRPRDQDDPVGQVDQLAVRSVDLLVHAQGLEVKDHGALVQDAHHDPFTVDHGDHRDAHVNLAAADFQLDAAVLGQAFLGDVHAGHDLQTADDRGFEAMDLGRHGLGLQHAVNAVPNAQAGRL
jgi:hypothetical protein